MPDGIGYVTRPSFRDTYGFGVGSLIRYRTYDGTARDVRVTEVEFDIKNGRAGFSAVLLGVAVPADQRQVWGYCSQVVHIIRP